MDISEEINAAGREIANAIHPLGALGQDANGGVVGSLSESIVGVTGALCRIAYALESVADAIREQRSSKECD